MFDYLAVTRSTLLVNSLFLSEYRTGSVLATQSPISRHISKLLFACRSGDLTDAISEIDAAQLWRGR